MGREIKRVALNFDWPLNQTWAGYLNPFYQYCHKCSYCEGTGFSPAAKRINDQWYGNAPFSPSETGSQLLTIKTPVVRAFAERNCKHAPDFYGSSEQSVVREAQRLVDMWNLEWCHHLEQADVDALLEKGRLYDLTRDGHIPTVVEVNEWSIGGFLGHDSINHWTCVQAKCERLGIQQNCKHCNGSGEQWDTQSHKYLYDTWEDIEPPQGEGWQLWETVSEGSPISPVFTNDEAFAQWLIENGHSEHSAREFIKIGSVPSLMIHNNEIKSNIDMLDMACDEGAES